MEKLKEVDCQIKNVIRKLLVAISFIFRESCLLNRI